MKTARLLLAMILASLFSGCANVDKMIPAITAAQLNYTRTGKFSTTTVEAKNLKRETGTLTADEISIRHSNAWMPNVEIKVTGYVRQLNAEDGK